MAPSTIASSKLPTAPVMAARGQLPGGGGGGGFDFIAIATGGGGGGSAPGPTGADATSGSSGVQSAADALSPLNELVKTLGGGLLETIGLDGSFLPDITSLMPVQMAKALLSAFAGPIQGAVAGKLGIQTPGWYPGMPAEEFAQLQGSTTSGGPFGIPDIAAPPPSPERELGAPPLQSGGHTINIDQSQNFNNSHLGWDPQEVNRQRDRDQNRRAVPRLSSFAAGLGK